MVSATSPPAGFDDDEPHLTDAVRAAAGDLRASGPLPRSSEDVLRFAVRDRLRDAGVSDIAHENSSITGGWSPIPGKLDLYTPARRPHRWAAEAGRRPCRCPGGTVGVVGLQPVLRQRSGMSPKRWPT
jgi:hypothetical protein